MATNTSLPPLSTLPTAPMNAIPSELQLPLVVAVGLIGFLLVIGMSSLSAKALKEESGSAPSTPRMSAPGTPEKLGTPVGKKVGSVMTPGGRRSARIAGNTRRKED